MKQAMKRFVKKFILISLVFVAACVCGYSMFMITVSLTALPALIVSTAWLLLFLYANVRTPKKKNQYEH